MAHRVNRNGGPVNKRRVPQHERANSQPQEIEDLKERMNHKTENLRNLLENDSEDRKDKRRPLR